MAIGGRSGPRAKAKRTRATMPKGATWDSATRDRPSMRRSLPATRAASRHMGHRPRTGRGVGSDGSTRLRRWPGDRHPARPRVRRRAAGATAQVRRGHPATGDDRPAGQGLDRPGLVAGDEHGDPAGRRLADGLVEQAAGRRRRARRGARRAATARASGRSRTARATRRRCPADSSPRRRPRRRPARPQRPQGGVDAGRVAAGGPHGEADVLTHGEVVVEVGGVGQQAHPAADGGPAGGRGRGRAPTVGPKPGGRVRRRPAAGWSCPHRSGPPPGPSPPRPRRGRRRPAGGTAPSATGVAEGDSGGKGSCGGHGRGVNATGAGGPAGQTAPPAAAAPGRAPAALSWSRAG